MNAETVDTADAGEPEPVVVEQCDISPDSAHDDYQKYFARIDRCITPSTIVQEESKLEFPLSDYSDDFEDPTDFQLSSDSEREGSDEEPQTTKSTAWTIDVVSPTPP